MTGSLHRTIGVLAILSLTIGSAGVAVAQSRGKRGSDDSGDARPPSFDARTGKRINEAIDKLQAGQTAEARAAIDKINLNRLSPYEAGRVWQLLAAVDQAEEKYKAAREHLGEALSSGGLNEQETSSVRFQIAKLYLVEEQWGEGAKVLEQWFADEPNPNSAAYYALAVAYYQLGDMDKALAPAQKAVDLGGDKTQEGWLQLLLALRIRREEYAQALPILMQLVERAPEKKAYWVQVASVALTLEKYDTATSLMQLAHSAGLLTEGTEIRRLAELLMHAGIPYRAAEVLKAALEEKKLQGDRAAYELLGNCWIAAREYDKAIEPLGRAGELADSGEPYVRLAEVYFRREDWANAAEVLQRGFGKGHLKRPGAASLLMGLALYNQNKVQDARTWFERAATHSESKAQAEGWLRHTGAAPTVSNVDRSPLGRSDTASSGS
jgi:tetratricopeptide (TPR) repeat protein